MRKGGAITANTLTYFTPRAVVMCVGGGGTDSYCDYVIWNRPVWLRSSGTEPPAAGLKEKPAPVAIAEAAGWDRMYQRLSERAFR